MKFLLFIYTLLLSQILSAQQISFNILPETLKRNQFDISTAIPYKDGLLTAVMESDGKDEKYIIKLGIIRADKSIQKSIDIGFKSEPKMKLAGIYAISNRPVIIYSTREGKQNDRHVKAVLINPGTLKMDAVKEIAVFPQERINDMEVKENNLDADWLSTLEIQPSQDSTKYFITQLINGEHHYIVFDADANVLQQRTVKFPDGASDFSVCLTKKDKLLIFYNLPDVPGEKRYKNDFKSIIRVIDLAENKSKEIVIDKSFGSIRKIRMLFKNGQVDELHLLSIYSESFSDDDISGALHFSFNTITEQTTLIAKKELPYDIKLSSLFPDYFMEGSAKKTENYPLFERLIISGCNWRNGNTIDLSIEYFVFGFPFLNFQSVINFYFNGNEIIITPIEKKQLGPEEKAFTYCGAVPVAYNNNLVFLFNDNPENLERDSKPREFNPLSKSPGSLVAIIVDEKGNTTKREVYGKFDKNSFPELFCAHSVGTAMLLTRISKPDTRDKEYKLGFITLE